jgi:hypothetical protein
MTGSCCPIYGNLEGPAWIPSQVIIQEKSMAWNIKGIEFDYNPLFILLSLKSMGCCLGSPMIISVLKMHHTDGLRTGYLIIIWSIWQQVNNGRGKFSPSGEWCPRAWLLANRSSSQTRKNTQVSSWPRKSRPLIKRMPNYLTQSI